MRLAIRYDAKLKEMVCYEDLMACVNEVRERGLPAFRFKKDASTQLGLSRLFGLFLSFLVVTVQRNKTVREMRFEDFKVQADERISLELFATKTKKRAQYSISPKYYAIIKNLQRQRDWMKEELRKCEAKLKEKSSPSELAALYRHKLLMKRRLESVFTFYSSSAVDNHLKQFRAFMMEKRIPHAESFTIKDIRACALQRINAKVGLDAAVKMAQHSKASTTLNYYLMQREDRVNVDLLDIVDTNFAELETDKNIETDESNYIDNDNADSDSEGYESGDDPERDYLRLVAGN